MPNNMGSVGRDIPNPISKSLILIARGVDNGINNNKMSSLKKNK